jgi:hypothetical protein
MRQPSMVDKQEVIRRAPLWAIVSIGDKPLEAIVAERGQPLAIRCDNGPELTSRHFLAWCVERRSS